MVSAKQSWQQRRAARKKMAAKVAKDLCEWLWEHNWDAFQLSGRIFPRDGNKNLGATLEFLENYAGRCFTTKLCKSAVRTMLRDHHLAPAKRPSMSYSEYVKQQAKLLQQVAQRAKRTARNRRLRERKWWKAWAMDEYETQPISEEVTWH